MDDFNTDLYSCITNFLARIANNEVEIYNEASVKYELAIQMRATFGDALKVQLERNIGFFGLDSKRFVKKAADIVVFTPDQRQKHCIEIKFPRSGQYPEQMFLVCKDVFFLEQLVAASFCTSYFLMLADDNTFWQGPTQTGIYAMFRAGRPIGGKITKPTGSKDEVLSLNGEYITVWRDLQQGMKYLLIEVGSARAKEDG